MELEEAEAEDLLLAAATAAAAADDDDSLLLMVELFTSIDDDVVAAIAVGAELLYVYVDVGAPSVVVVVVRRGRSPNETRSALVSSTDNSITFSDIF